MQVLINTNTNAGIDTYNILDVTVWTNPNPNPILLKRYFKKSNILVILFPT